MPSIRCTWLASGWSATQPDLQGIRHGHLSIWEPRSEARSDTRFATNLAMAYSDKSRPCCLCYGRQGCPCTSAASMIAFLVKRMPNTGSNHHPDCDSYEPPPELSGLGEVAGAIQEDIDAGSTALKLDFKLWKLGSRSLPISSGVNADSVRTDGSRLTLRGTLHYLWEQAQLNRWTPGMAGKRSWYVVRKHLLLSSGRQDRERFCPYRRAVHPRVVLRRAQG